MKKAFALIVVVSLFVANMNAAGINLKAKKTKNTKVEPVYIQKIEATAEGQNGEKQDLEGILFFFEITKIKKNNKVLYFQELRDFEIDGVSYAQITKDSIGLEIEPHSEFLESYKLIERNPEAKKIVKNEKNGTIMQTVIYGAKLPKSGRVSVTAQIGWADLNEEKIEMVNGKIEDFVFEFDLSALPDEKHPSEITETEKQELLKLINDFKDDKDFSRSNLQNYSYIIDFASENEIVKIEMNSACWPEEVSSSEYAPVFLLAYVCGNLEKQLVSGNYINATEEGVEFELLKYKQLKEMKNDINICFFEDLM